MSQPFGDNQQKLVPPGSNGCDPTPDFFTGKQRDQESQLDQFAARYFSSHWGRWMSPDWSGRAAAVPYVNWGNPQSLNLYAYVGNDPVSGEDADGHSVYRFGDGTDDSLDGAGGDGGIIDHQRMMMQDAEASASAQNVAASQFTIRVDTFASALPPLAVDRLAPSPASLFFYSLSAQLGLLAAETSPVCVTGVGCAAPGVLAGLSAASAITGVAIQIIQNSNANSGQDGTASAPAGQGNATASQTNTPKPEAQSEPGTKKDRSLEGTQQQLEDLERAQKNQDKTERPIDSTAKSQQNLKNKLNKIKSLSDVEE